MEKTAENRVIHRMTAGEIEDWRIRQATEKDVKYGYSHLFCFRFDVGFLRYIYKKISTGD
ncbi:hypothetical protein [Endozoicomonas ascidiicola]|uniref:hypothetical protein n=1 Tax=Endozoicomonas ascidiicola TaxID=1698521 RepID=UPI000A4BCCB8|nr:hypothetical protein [Endozoicomonas ascidiicola]